MATGEGSGTLGRWLRERCVPITIVLLCIVLAGFLIPPIFRSSEQSAFTAGEIVEVEGDQACAIENSTGNRYCFAIESIEPVPEEVEVGDVIAIEISMRGKELRSVGPIWGD